MVRRSHPLPRPEQEGESLTSKSERGRGRGAREGEGGRDHLYDDEGVGGENRWEWWIIVGSSWQGPVLLMSCIMCEDAHISIPASASILLQACYNSQNLIHGWYNIIDA